MRRIGLFGGTFNPIHTGHLRSAVEVSEAFSLDRVILIPSATPPHKRLAGAVDAGRRYEMTRLAAQGTPGLAVSDVELRRGGPSFTVDTVKQARSLCPDAQRCFLIIGQDAFFEIDTWKSFKSIFQSIEIIVIKRPMPSRALSPEAFLKQRIHPGYAFSQKVPGYENPELQTVYFHEVTQMAVSSTKIRELVRAGRSIRFLTPDPVISYIKEQELYK